MHHMLKGFTRVGSKWTKVMQAKFESATFPDVVQEKLDILRIIKKNELFCFFHVFSGINWAYINFLSS